MADFKKDLVRFPQLLPVAVARNSFDNIHVVNKFGYNADIDTAEETVWDLGGLYSYPGSAQTMKLTSSSSLDTASGTNARRVHIEGLDANFNPASESLWLDGLDVVSTSNIYARIFRAFVTNVGASLQNIGTIYVGAGTVTSGVPDDKFAGISLGENQTLMGIYTVPAGKQAYLQSFKATTSAQGTATKFATIRLIARPNGDLADSPFQVKDKFIIVNASDGSFNHADAPEPFDEKTDIEVRATSNTGTTDVAVSFDLWVVNSG